MTTNAKRGWNHHRKTLHFFNAMFDNYVRDIETEVDLLHETGMLFVARERRRREDSTVHVPEAHRHQREDGTPPSDDTGQVFEVSPPPFPDDDIPPENVSFQSRRMAESVSVFFV